VLPPVAFTKYRSQLSSFFMRPDTFIDSQSAGLAKTKKKQNKKKRGRGSFTEGVTFRYVLVVCCFIFHPFFEKPALSGQGKEPPSAPCTPSVNPPSLNNKARCRNMFEVRTRCQVFLCRGFLLLANHPVNGKGKGKV